MNEHTTILQKFDHRYAHSKLAVLLFTVVENLDVTKYFSMKESETDRAMYLYTAVYKYRDINSKRGIL